VKIQYVALGHGSGMAGRWDGMALAWPAGGMALVKRIFCSWPCKRKDRERGMNTW